MNNYLAIDTSSEYMTALACKNGRVSSVFLPDCAMKHSVLLMDAIDGALGKAGLTLEECDFFAAVVGAGSFTGIRIGVATAKGLALATGKPTLPVTSFEVAAYNAVDGEKAMALIDALHGRYYVCGFDEKKEETFSPAYLTQEEILTAADAGGYTLYTFGKLPIAERRAVKIADPVEGLKRATEALSGNEKRFGPLRALYIRKSQAEENLR